MKKLYTLLAFVAISTSLNAQNLLANGDFELWTAGVPNSFIVSGDATNGGTVTQEIIDFHGGTSSAKFTAPTGSGTLKAAATDFAIVAGHSYTLTYWYKDESTTAKSRHWGQWRTASALVSDSSLQPSIYNGDTTGWQQVTVTATAPATATILRFDYRVYQEAAGSNGGIIFVDDMSIVDNTLSVQQNKIAGLNVYPNPVSNGTLYITSNSSNAKTVAIYDILGKQVLESKTANNAVNVSNLKSGAYIVKITEDEKTDTRKLIIE